MKRTTWIDALRGIAIIAVVFDHALFLYPQFRNDVLWWHTYFSVPWFVFLAGVSNTLGALKRERKLPQFVISFWIRRLHLFLWYGGASLLIYLIDKGGAFRFSEFFQKLLLFSVEPTYYFINLIMQLYFVFPILVTIILLLPKRWMRLLCIPVSYVFAQYLLLRIPAPWPFAPAGKILGSLYFPVYVAGIVFAAESLILQKIVFAVSVVLFSWYELLLIRTNGGFISIVQNFSLLAWSLSLLHVIAPIVEHIRHSLPVKFLVFLGKRSLPIYLFHFFFLRHLSFFPQTSLDFLGVVLLSILASTLLELAVTQFKFANKP